MDFASTTPLPRSALSHSHNFIPRLLAPCQSKSIAPCEFALFARRYPISRMKTVGVIRHANLLILIERYKSLADLNVALGLVRTDAPLSQIKNQNKTSRGKPKMMGATLARRIEKALKLGDGWRDNDHSPPTYRQQRIDQAVKAMEKMAPWQFDQAIKIIDTLAEPKSKNGTDDA